MSVTSRPVAVSPSSSPRPSRLSMSAREALSGYAFISPWLVGLALFTAIPMVASFVLSFTDFDPREPGATTFIGLANYERMLHDPLLAQALSVTVRFALLNVPVTMVVALGVAMLVNSTLLAGRNVFRTLFYMPMQIPIVASTLIWIGMLNASTGWLNGIPACSASSDRTGSTAPTGCTRR
jgi:ABC-type sugar transport system permease subunit